ncbi:fungal-specific transcription factor domain-containing protein [Gymnopilus junonius]|uniref:Fungal-specific transcription factor domain-containing protein n=1 Tax=Gymnopilus junonius TaxID=109634 RepID=A0A9P5TT78_GYMJU|nr:fungal-specific transcription factor domain-containing protein [Gymnopilus junonius]
MSSNEEEPNDGEASSGLFQTMKKRRIQRACDICRRKKSDGVQMPGNRCSNCISYDFDCTYVEAAKRRGPPKGYVESIENRMDKLEKVLRQLCPDESVFKELNSLIDKWNPEQPIPKSITSVVHDKLGCTNALPGVAATDVVTSAIRGMADSKPLPRIDPAEDDDETNLRLAESLRRMTLDPTEYRFFGKSSGAMLIRTALELKGKYTGDALDLTTQLPPIINRRKVFWTLRPWEKIAETIPTQKFEFPEDDVALHCVDLYFTNINLYLPLLHRPSFEKSINDGLHLTNNGFAHVYLLVCALGARYSEDPRVLLDGIDSWHSAGWKWFDQVQMVKRSIMGPPTLYDIQRYCLSVQFLQGSSAPQSCWTLVGIGIRLAQDVGAHRRKVNNHTMTAEDEMWKRAFWVLVCMDRMVSSSLGRPCAIQDEEFDLDLPVDCDDEYWDNDSPELRFKQPVDKPSLLSAFILYIKLHQILAFSLRTIYSINKSKALMGLVGPKWEQHIVAELDSALNKWVDSVPDHLRWDPNREDVRFFNQSATLYAAYYHVQILVHRPFIPSPSKPSPLSFPSLAICTNAARSCTHVVDIQQKRCPSDLAIPQMQVCMSVFTSGIVLLLSIWGGKRSGLSMDPSREMMDVYKCMHILKSSEDRWHSAGRLWDIMYELAYVGDLPLPQPSPPGNKRERDAEIPISANAQSRDVSSRNMSGPRNIAGSRRVGKDTSATSQSRRPTQQQSSVDISMTAAHQHSSISYIKSQPQLFSLPRYPYIDPSSPASSSSASGLSVQPSPTAATSLTPTPPPASAVEEYLSLPVYSNELGSLPLHGGCNDRQSPPQQQNTNSWFSFREPSTSFSSLDDFGTLPRSNQLSNQQAAGRGFGSIANTSDSEMMTQIQPQGAFGYGMDAEAAMAVGMMFDGMSPFTSYGQQLPPSSSSSTFDTGSMGAGIGVGGNGGPVNNFLGNSYRPPGTDAGMGLEDLMADGSFSVDPGAQQQRRQNTGIGGNGRNTGYDFIDNDTMSMWSNAPAGFTLDEWGSYLTNVSELTQGHAEHQPSGSSVPIGSGADDSHRSHLQQRL